MACNKFKIDHLQSKLHLPIKKEDWLTKDLTSFVNDALLMKLLSEAKNMYLGSEKHVQSLLLALFCKPYIAKMKANLLFFQVMNLI